MAELAVQMPELALPMAELAVQMPELVRADDPGAVGWILDEPVTQTDLDDYLLLLASGAAAQRAGLAPGTTPLPVDQDGRRAVLRGWAAKLLLVERFLACEAGRLGVHDLYASSEWADCLERAGEIVVPQPTAGEAREYFRRNRDRYRVRAARRALHVLVSDRPAAERFLPWACDPSGVAALAASESLDCASRARGGDLGWVERGQLAGPLEDAIFAARPGKVVGPLGSAFGWHLVVVVGVRPPRPGSFAEYRAAILTELRNDRRRTAVHQWLQHRLACGVKVPAGTEHPVVPGLPGSGHRH